MKKHRRAGKREIASLCRLLQTTDCTTENVRDIKKKIKSIEESLREVEPERDEEEIQRRATLDENESLLDVFNCMWMTVAFNTDTDNCLTKKGYVRFFLVLSKVLGGFVNEKMSRVSVEEDWEHDTEVHGKISKEVFFDLLFEVIETWSVFVDPTYYAAMAWALLDGVADLRTIPPKLRTLRTVPCVLTTANNEAALLQQFYNPEAKKERLSLKLQSASLQRVPEVQKRLATRRDVSSVDDNQLLMIAAMARLVKNEQGIEQGLTDSDESKSEVGDDNNDNEDYYEYPPDETTGSYFHRDLREVKTRESKRGETGMTDNFPKTLVFDDEEGESRPSSSEFSKWLGVNTNTRKSQRQGDGLRYLAATHFSARRISTIEHKQPGSSSPATNSLDGPCVPDPDIQSFRIVGMRAVTPTRRFASARLGSRDLDRERMVKEEEGGGGEGEDGKEKETVAGVGDGGGVDEELSSLMHSLSVINERDRLQKAEEAARLAAVEEERRRVATAAAQQAEIEARAARHRKEEMQRAEERERLADEAKLKQYFSEVFNRELIITPASLRRQALAEAGDNSAAVHVDWGNAFANVSVGDALPETAVSDSPVMALSVSVSTSPRISSPPSLITSATGLFRVDDPEDENDGSPAMRVRVEPALESFLLYTHEEQHQLLHQPTTNRLSPPSPNQFYEIEWAPPLGAPQPDYTSELAAARTSDSPGSPPASPDSVLLKSPLRAFPHEAYSAAVERVAEAHRVTHMPWGHRRAVGVLKSVLRGPIAPSQRLTKEARNERDLMALQYTQLPAKQQQQQQRKLVPARGRPGPSKHALLHRGEDPPVLLNNATRGLIEQPNIKSQQLSHKSLSLDSLPGPESAFIQRPFTDTLSDVIISSTADSGISSVEMGANPVVVTVTLALPGVDAQPSLAASSFADKFLTSDNFTTHTQPNSTGIIDDSLSGYASSIGPELTQPDSHSVLHTFLNSSLSHPSEPIKADANALSLRAVKVGLGMRFRQPSVTTQSRRNRGDQQPPMSASGSAPVPAPLLEDNNQGDEEASCGSISVQTPLVSIVTLEAPPSPHFHDATAPSTPLPHHQYQGFSPAPAAPFPGTNGPSLRIQSFSRTSGHAANLTSTFTSTSISTSNALALPAVLLEKVMNVDSPADEQDAVATVAGTLGLSGPHYPPAPTVMRTSLSVAGLGKFDVLQAQQVKNPAPWLPGGLTDEMEHNRSNAVLAWEERKLLRQHVHNDASKVVLSVKRQDGVRRQLDEWVLANQAQRRTNDAQFLHFASASSISSVKVVGNKFFPHKLSRRKGDKQ